MEKKTQQRVKKEQRFWVNSIVLIFKTSNCGTATNCISLTSWSLRESDSVISSGNLS